MLNIDKDIFSDNLRLTQQYCRSQLDGHETDIAKIFRSYNPAINGKPLFSFKVNHFDFDIIPGVNYCTLTKWEIDPTESGNEHLIQMLFDQQLNFKRSVALPAHDIHQGGILVLNVNETVVDGASAVQSFGLIDIYDMPPIDTWFYLTTHQGSEFLFAWIPEEMRHHANNAVLVNCVDCLGWFEDSYPEGL